MGGCIASARQQAHNATHRLASMLHLAATIVRHLLAGA